MSKKLLNDVAGILAELEVSYSTANEIADSLYSAGILSKEEFEDWLNTASNAPSGGECGC